jgi:hypothetical protein
LSESSDLNGRNYFAYGTAEHFAFEMQKMFTPAVGAFVVFMCDKEEEDRNIAFFLNAVLERYGPVEAQWAAMYLQDFDVLPVLMPETKERVVLMRLDFDEDTDPDLKRFKD